MIEQLKTTFYKDFVQVEDEIGNRIIVLHKMFPNTEPNMQWYEAQKQAIGAIFLDRMYGKVKTSFETIDKSFEEWRAEKTK